MVVERSMADHPTTGPDDDRGNSGRGGSAPGSAEQAAIDPDTVGPGLASGPLDVRLAAVIYAARFHGVDLDQTDLRLPAGETTPSPASLAVWVREQGLWAKGARLSWKQIMNLQGPPVVLLLDDGSAVLLVGSDKERDVVMLRDPLGPSGAPATVGAGGQGGGQTMAVDRLRLSAIWSGDALLVRRSRTETLEEAPFTLAWLARLVLREKRSLRDILTASLTLSCLSIIPPFIIMAVIDKVIVHHSMNTLVLMCLIMGVAVLFETLLGYARRELVQVVGTRLDARLNLHIFNRLLALRLDYFESNPTGGTTYQVSQVFKVRDFLTGKLMSTFLDMATLVILLPFLFWLESTLAWVVLGVSMLIALIIMCFLPAMRRAWSKLVAAETLKGSTLVETVHGIRTVKSLALEAARREEWDHRVAESGRWRLAAGRLANWPQTLVTPLERMLDRGVLLLGAYFALSDNTGVEIGGLIAFMMLGSRVAQPLVGLARLMEDYEDVRASVSEVGRVLNNPTETKASQGGLRPRFDGAIEFNDVTFTYPLGKVPALDRVSFSVPAGTMLGVVGRSGSGKSTIARLLQGINREYSGFVRLDNAELREINLVHLRRSFGVVLQDNFLFRGTVRDNIIAGRAGLTLEDAILAARLAGAEEFIERLPAGYETWIEEGSANLSGGQKQRLAIARALISDPRIMILDEATSALDPESEALVNANLVRIGNGRTMVIVSHRLSSLVDCHQILVMDKGRVADCAPHSVLLERCSIYRQLWAQQNRHISGPQRQGGMKPMLAEGDD
jgi:HlyB family type I secretion system ABC transporter